MNFSLVKIKKSDLAEFKKDMQKAFQKGFEDKFGKPKILYSPKKISTNHWMPRAQ